MYVCGTGGFVTPWQRATGDAPHGHPTTPAGCSPRSRCSPHPADLRPSTDRHIDSESLSISGTWRCDGRHSAKPKAVLRSPEPLTLQGPGFQVDGSGSEVLCRAHDPGMRTCWTTEPSGRVGSRVVGTSLPRSTGSPMSTHTAPPSSTVGWISPACAQIKGGSPLDTAQSWEAGGVFLTAWTKSSRPGFGARAGKALTLRLHRAQTEIHRWGVESWAPQRSLTLPDKFL